MAELNDQLKGQPDSGPGTPRCPHCGTEFAGMGLFQWLVESWLILATYCPNCKKSLHFQVVPAQIVQPGAGGEEQPNPTHRRRPILVS